MTLTLPIVSGFADLHESLVAAEKDVASLTLAKISDYVETEPHSQGGADGSHATQRGDRPTASATRAIHSFLKGAKNLSWALRVLRGQQAYALFLLGMEFTNHSGTPRYRELRDALERKLE